MFIERVDVGGEIWAMVEQGPCPLCFGEHRHAHQIHSTGSWGTLTATPIQLEAAAFLDALVRP